MNKVGVWSEEIMKPRSMKERIESFGWAERSTQKVCWYGAD
jgi:hypothetical protein